MIRAETLAERGGLVEAIVGPAVQEMTMRRNTAAMQRAAGLIPLSKPQIAIRMQQCRASTHTLLPHPIAPRHATNRTREVMRMTQG